MAASASTLPRDPVLVRGVVYEDTRGAGPRRRGDRGIPGMMVSNGRDVALTGPDGAWALAVEPGDSAFVIKPSQWIMRTSAAGLPQFSYLYQPAGSPRQPGSRFPVIEPTGPLPASIDFALMRREEAHEFEALLGPIRNPTVSRSSATCATTSLPPCWASAGPLSASTTATWWRTISRSIRAICAS
jgi:hypothetical protein